MSTAMSPRTARRTESPSGEHHGERRDRRQRRAVGAGQRLEHGGESAPGADLRPDPRDERGRGVGGEHDDAARGDDDGDARRANSVRTSGAPPAGTLGRVSPSISSRRATRSAACRRSSVGSPRRARTATASTTSAVMLSRPPRSMASWTSRVAAACGSRLGAAGWRGWRRGRARRAVRPSTPGCGRPARRGCSQ